MVTTLVEYYTPKLISYPVIKFRNSI